MSLPSSYNSSNAIIMVLLLVAVDHSRLVDGILVVRDSTELRISVVKNFRLDRVLDENISI